MNNIIERNNIQVDGYYKLQCHNADGSLKWEKDIGHNVVTYAGKALAATLLGGTGTAFRYLALGTGATAESASQTALVSELNSAGLSRASATQSVVTNSSTGDTRRFVTVWTCSLNTTVQEIGLFNSATYNSGTMFSRKLTGATAVLATETLTATYDIIFS